MRKINFYLAAGLKDLQMAADLIAMISAIDPFCCSYDWTSYGSVVGKEDEVCSKIAQAEVDGVLQADVLFFLSPGARGSHVEFGIAIAKRIPIVILYREEDFLSRPPSVFYYLSQVRKYRLGGSGENSIFFKTLAGELSWEEQPRQS